MKNNEGKANTFRVEEEKRYLPHPVWVHRNQLSHITFSEY